MPEDINAALDRLGGTSQPPRQPDDSGIDKSALLRLAALIPIAMARGGQSAVSGLLGGYQRAVAQRRELEQQQGQQDWQQQYQQAQLTRQDAAEGRLQENADRQAEQQRLEQRRKFLELATGNPDADEGEAMQRLEMLTRQAPSFGVSQLDVEQAAYVAPTRREKAQITKMLADVDKMYPATPERENLKLANGMTVAEARQKIAGTTGTAPVVKPTASDDDQVWVKRNGVLTPIKKGTAQPGDVPYDPVAARRGSGGGDGGGAAPSKAETDIDRIADAVAAGRRKLSDFTPTTRLEIAASMERRGLKEAPSAYAAERTTRTRNSVNALLGKVNEWTTGFGSLLANIPRTQARAFRAQLDTLKASIAFNELTEMRAASRTGGALGSISDREMTLLSSALGALDTAQEPSEVKAQLEQILASLDRWDAAQKKAASGTDAEATPPPNTRGDESRRRVLPAGRMKVGRFDVEIEP